MENNALVAAAKILLSEDHIAFNVKTLLAFVMPLTMAPLLHPCFQPSCLSTMPTS